MSRFKGTTLLESVALTIVVVAVCIGISILLFIFNVLNIAKIRGDVELALIIDDEGSNILSFLNTKKGNFTHAEILGTFEAKNMPPELNDELDDTLGKFKNYYLRIQNSRDWIKKSSAEPKEGTVQVKVPLPGGRTGTLEMVVW